MDALQTLTDREMAFIAPWNRGPSAAAYITEAETMLEKVLALMLLLLLGGTILHSVITRVIAPLRKPPKN